MGAMGMNYPKASLSSTPTALSALNYSMKLVTADEKKTVIAEFHRAHHILKKQKARVEVQPAGMEMLDYIVLTFVFAENKRRERIRRASSGGWIMH
jgi:predicted Zn-ribbon and HTH transcriptional regulator